MSELKAVKTDDIKNIKDNSNVLLTEGTHTLTTESYHKEWRDGDQGVYCRNEQGKKKLVGTARMFNACTNQETKKKLFVKTDEGVAFKKGVKFKVVVKDKQTKEVTVPTTRTKQETTSEEW